MTINLKPKHVVRNSEAKIGGKTRVDASEPL